LTVKVRLKDDLANTVDDRSITRFPLRRWNFGTDLLVFRDLSVRLAQIGLQRSGVSAPFRIFKRGHHDLVHPAFNQNGLELDCEIEVEFRKTQPN
jgi:hypothetical protein